MIHLIIHDTIGNVPGPEYTESLPHCQWTAHNTSADEEHPHGLMVAWNAAICTYPELTKVHFVRGFDGHGVALSNGADTLTEYIESYPGSYVIRSWGGYDQDSEDQSIGDLWLPWITNYEAVLNRLNIIDCSAAGNGDWNDLDNDIDYPQKLMTESIVCGSHDRQGTPSIFSGDGRPLSIVTCAENIYLRNRNSWDVGSGTSYSAPKVAGILATAGKHTKQTAMRYLRTSTRFKVWDAKSGYGTVEQLWQDRVKLLPTVLQPPTNLISNISWMDFHHQTGRTIDIPETILVPEPPISFWISEETRTEMAKTNART